MENTLSLRRRIYRVIFFTDTQAGQRFDNILLVTILASLIVVMLDSIEAVHSQYSAWMSGLEWMFTALFAIEYLVRIYCSPKPLRYIFSFYGLIDLLAILPGLLTLFFPSAQYLLIVRVIRMIRVFRVLKLSPYLRQANFLMTALRGSKQKIIVFFSCIAILVTVYGTLMYVIEGPEHGFTSIPKGIYWAVVTLTTVGFGDIVPKTALGQFLSTLVMITGYSIIAVPTGIFTAELASAMHGGDVLEHECPSCKKDAHEPHAAFCNRCGNPLYPRESHPRNGDLGKNDQGITNSDG
ncbi:ion transporter [Pseudomonas sp. M30-35]|uniref:ion transporter n=1 Tax=Pseudomonas sp. M30-35 TaxID=1981174 RepID=UPI000B3C502B|nr:ion transporter [Pseudomonas sp. M30-35]ARU88997.1 ion transporter [Pseudomonas sp. M30-35]